MSTPLTAQFFLRKHFEVLSAEFDIYMVANFEQNTTTTYSPFRIISAEHIGINREINLTKDLKAVADLRKYLKMMKFDAILSVTPKAGLIGMLAGRWAGIPHRVHIFTGQVWHTRKGVFKQLLIALDKLIRFNATETLVDGESQRQFLIANGVVRAESSKVLGKGSISGVDLNRFVASEAIRHKWRSELGYNAENVVFMFLGRTNYDKGIIELTEAFRMLSDRYPEARMLYVGFDEDGLVPTIKEMLGNRASFHYFGSTSVPEELLQACDVFCLPSHREGFGTSVIEASLLGKPCICSDTYGLMETIVDGVTGLRHPVGDSNAIFGEMEKLMTQSELRKTLGENGVRYVHDYFSAETISNEWLKFFRKLLQT